MKIFIIFPNQLFEDIGELKKFDKIAIIYENLFFEQFNFHKTKIAYHIATTRFYSDYLNKNNIKSEIIDLRKKDDFELFFRDSSQIYSSITYYDTVDFLLEKRINRFSEKYNILTNKLDSQNFILKNSQLDELKPNKNNYFQTDFYIKMRKMSGILMEYGKPIGGKWTYDAENRKKIPKGTYIPQAKKFQQNEYRKQAIDFVNENYPNNYGDFALEYYPINFDEANYHLEQFIENNLINFGPYQDAILREGVFNYHSNLSAVLNIGLLTPYKIIKKIIEAHTDLHIPLNSIEGFIRQVIGWREFIRMVYVQKGVQQRTSNHFNHNRILDERFWNGTVGIEPLDDSIRKTLKYGYTHHIERLMILGNFMLINEIHPDEVYKWFMSLSIDAYDWVMVPNVYGMSQYADGGLITTKPYFSGSNYILKLSDYSKGNWSEIWDALYWRFIFEHKQEFDKNPRMNLNSIFFNKLGESKVNKHLFVSNNYLYLYFSK